MPAPTLSSWIDTIMNSIGQALPNVTIIVLNGTVGGSEGANTNTRPGTPLATIYSDPYGADLIDQISAPLNTSDGDGTFQFWAAPGYYVIQAFGPGIFGQLVYGVALGGSGGGGGGTVGPLVFNMVPESADFTAAVESGSNPTNYYLCTSGADGIAGTLPSAAGIAGKTIMFKKVDSGTASLFIVPFGEETIDGLTSFEISSQYQYIGLVSDGTNWAFFTRN